MKVAELFEIVRKFLGWSYQDVAMKSGQYSAEYVKQVHQGRPFREVEENLIVTYINGLAEKAVHLVFGDRIPSDLRDKLIAKFARIVHQNSLPLENARALVEKVSQDSVPKASFRLGTMDAVRVEIAWEEVLASIVDEFNQNPQGRLLEDSSDADGSTYLSLVSNVPSLSYQPKQDPQTILAVCNFCHKPLPENRASRHACGHPNDDYL